MKRSSSSERPRSRTIAELACACLLAAGCAQQSAGAAPAPVSSGGAPILSEADLVVLPNNTTIQVVKGKLAALGTDGQVTWQLTLPDNDVPIAPIAVALNSVAYVRGAKAIHAMLPDGKWLWSKPLEGRSFAKTRAADTPIATSDSTVALIVGDDLIRFDHTGAVRFRVTMPEGHVTGNPVAGMDGSLLVPTSGGIYSVSPDGNIAWRSTLGG